MITLASLPALFERLDRPAVAGTLFGAMAREPASFHHVPSLADLGVRLRDTLGDEKPERWAATGAAMDLQDTAAYALNQIDVARQALAVAGEQGALAGLTARELQVLRLIADGSDDARRCPSGCSSRRRLPTTTSSTSTRSSA